MEALDYWKLCERVTIFQAIMLILGFDPKSMVSADVEPNSRDSDRAQNMPEGYGAVKTALLGAVHHRLLEANIQQQVDYDYNGHECGWIPDSIDIDNSFVGIAAIRSYLRERNFPSDFFSSSQEISSANYLDPENPCYAPKLAAAVEAWTVVTGEKKFETESTPKQLMEKWLREHAKRFGLNRPDGKLNEDGIAQITKIANWRPEGGASKSAGSRNTTTPKKRRNRGTL